MAVRTLRIAMEGVTGRLGTNQHLIRALLSIRQEGGLPLKNSVSPICNRQRVAELLNTLVMGGVARDQLEAVLQGYRRDDRISHADRLADAFEIARDPARQRSGGLIQGKHFLFSNSG